MHRLWANAEIDVPNFAILARVALTITVSTASPERGFSQMKLIMTRLRTCLSQPMLDALMRLKLLAANNMSEKEFLQCVFEWFHQTDARRRFEW